jgi:hypothetical protein
MVKNRSLLPVILLSAVLLAGCTSSVPTTVTAPKLVQVEKGTSPLESDSAVVAARASALAEEVAWNSRNFAIKQYSGTTAAQRVKDTYSAWYGEYVTHSGAPTVWPGPKVWMPISVTPTADGSQVLFCDASRDWWVSKGHKASYDLAKGLLLKVDLVKDAKGRLTVSSDTPVDNYCDATGAPVQKFDPAPTLPKTIGSGDSIPPVGYKD